MRVDGWVGGGEGGEGKGEGAGAVHTCAESSVSMPGRSLTRVDRKAYWRCSGTSSPSGPVTFDRTRSIWTFVSRRLSTSVQSSPSPDPLPLPVTRGI